MAKLNIISADSHIFEPPDLWTSRIEARFRDRAPRVVRGKDSDGWQVENSTSSFGHVIQAGLRYVDPSAITPRARLEEVPQAAYEPHQHIKDMELDGVDGEVVFPSAGLGMFRVRDSELLSAIFRAYNDWLADFCSYYPDRIKGIAVINVDDVHEAVKELSRCRQAGLYGAMISTDPSIDAADYRGYELPKYEPLWAAAQDLAMSLNLHVGTVRYEREIMWDGGARDYILANNITWINQQVQREHWVRRAITPMIFSGVLERYPRLQVGIVEHELAWIPHFIRMMDHVYNLRPQFATHRFKNAMLPSDFFHRNVFAGFQEDAVGIQNRHTIGVDNILWGNDYPHSESTFPKSQEVLDKVLDGISQDERYKMVCGNAARIYHF